MSSLRVFGKYLDQPILVEKMRKSVPYVLGGAAGLYTLSGVSQAKDSEQKRKKFVESSTVLGVTVGSALLAPKIATKITGKKAVVPIKQIIKENEKNIDEFIKTNPIGGEVKNLLQKAKGNILKPKELEVLDKNLVDEGGKDLLKKLIPPPENMSSKDIFSEIGWLSIVGAVPVAGGVAGGVLADGLNGKELKKTLPNKIKEGVYQYLANIFMCNVGAGIALGILEKCNVKSRLARGLGMTTGILLTGVIGGSKIANIIGDKFINPMLGTKKLTKGDERTPELLDISLHTDDIATISMLSGLKWIEPTLPLFYTVSGYRAGIGYRNNKG